MHGCIPSFRGIQLSTDNGGSTAFHVRDVSRLGHCETSKERLGKALSQVLERCYSGHVLNLRTEPVPVSEQSSIQNGVSLPSCLRDLVLHTANCFVFLANSRLCISLLSEEIFHRNMFCSLAFAPFLSSKCTCIGLKLDCLNWVINPGFGTWLMVLSPVKKCISDAGS